MIRAEERAEEAGNRKGEQNAVGDALMTGRTQPRTASQSTAQRHHPNPQDDVERRDRAVRQSQKKTTNTPAIDPSPAPQEPVKPHAEARSPDACTARDYHARPRRRTARPGSVCGIPVSPSLKAPSDVPTGGNSNDMRRRNGPRLATLSTYRTRHLQIAESECAASEDPTHLRGGSGGVFS